jgi:hypothetical protein
MLLRKRYEIFDSPANDARSVSGRCLTLLANRKQKACRNFDLLVVGFLQPSVEVALRDRRQPLSAVRQFPSDAQIFKGRKPVPERNRFRTATRIAWGTRKVLTELSFRAKAKLGATILRRHAEACPLCVSTQGFRSVREIDQFLRGAGLR